MSIAHPKRTGRLATRLQERCAAAVMGRADAMIEAKPTVLIIDDDPDIRESLQSLLRTVGLDCKAMGSLAELLESGLPAGPTCLVLDVRLPGRSGLDFQRELAAAHINLPIIFITGYGDVPMSVQAMIA